MARRWMSRDEQNAIQVPDKKHRSAKDRNQLLRHCAAKADSIGAVKPKNVNTKTISFQVRHADLKF